MILIVKNVPNSTLSSKAANRKQIGTKCLQQPGGKEVCFFFFMPDPTDLFGLNFCSGHGEVVTAHKESLRIPVQKATQAWFSSVRSSFNYFFDTRKIYKNCKQTWKYLNAWRPLKEAIHAILCLLGVFTRYFSFCGIKDLSWLERHRDKSTSLLRREPA